MYNSIPSLQTKIYNLVPIIQVYTNFGVVIKTCMDGCGLGVVTCRLGAHDKKRNDDNKTQEWLNQMERIKVQVLGSRDGVTLAERRDQSEE